MTAERQLFSRREYHVVYGLPLAATVLGALAGYGLASSAALTGFLHELGGPIAGALLVSADNLALFTGLGGLGTGYLVSAWWVRRRRAAIPESENGPLHSKPDQP